MEEDKSRGKSAILKALFLLIRVNPFIAVIIGFVVIFIIIIILFVVILGMDENSPWFLGGEEDEGICTIVTAQGKIEGDKITATFTSSAGASAKNLKATIVDNEFTLKTKKNDKKQDITEKKFDLNGIKRNKLDFYSYENWYVTWTAGTGQRKLYDTGTYHPDKCGVMKYENKDGTEDYMIALGSYFGTKIGTRYKITFSSGKTVTAVLSDQKADKHTGKNIDPTGKHRYSENGVLEFMVDQHGKVRALNHMARKMGDVGYCSIKNYQIRPYITAITGINAKTEVNMTGKINNKKITLNGNIDGNNVTLKGKIKDNQFVATGEYGDGCSGDFAWPMKEWAFGRGWGVFTTSSGYPHIHQGIDISSGTNTAIYSMAAGKVVEVYNRNLGSSGLYVMIKHGKVYGRYQHLSSINVKEGQNVRKGEKIATQGSSCGPGCDGAIHLHFEIWKDWEYGRYSSETNNKGSTIDPLKYLPKTKKVPDKWYKDIGKHKSAGY